MGVDNSHDAPLVHHSHPVRHHENLIEVLADEQDGHALVPLSEQSLVHKLRGANVQTARRMLGNRQPWLLVNLATAFISATVIGQFGATIEQMVALAALMPIVASLGGNAGTQTMTVTVRALATRDLDIYNAGRVIRRELMVGLLNGAVIASLLGLAAGVLFANADLGLVIAAAMVINMLAAALGGILIPLLLDRFGADPAISSSIFTTMITDVIGFFAFLGLATWWLGLG